MSLQALANIKKSTEMGIRKEAEAAIKKAFSISDKDTLSEGFRSKLLNTSIHSLNKKALSKFYNEFLITKNAEPNNAELDKLFDAYKIAATYAGMYVTDTAIYTIKASHIPKGSYLEQMFHKLISGQPIDQKWIKEIVRGVSSKADNFDYLKQKVVKAVKPSSKFSELTNEFLIANIDIGHLYSNVEYLANIFTVSGIAESKLDDLKDAYGAIEKIPREKIRDVFDTLLNEEKSTLDSVIRDALFDELYSSQIRLLRKFTSSGQFSAAITFKLTKAGWLSKITEKEIKRIIDKSVVQVAPQLAHLNQEEGRRILAQYRKRLPLFYEALSISLQKEMSNLDILNISGSKTGKELIKEYVINILSGKGGVPKTQDTTVSKKLNSNTKSTSKPTTKVNQNKTRAIVKNPKAPPLRNLTGQFTSTVSLQALMQQMLHDTIKKNMQRPNLHYQTGRFAKSVKVEHISRGRDGALTAFLSYMRYPYATFEVGGKQGHKEYYPSRLINQSAREIAAKLTRERFTSVTIK